MSNVTHNPHACRSCESILPEADRRYWKGEAKAAYWHTIVEGPDLKARLPREAHFITILSHTLNDEGLPACYRGSLYFEFDPDDPAQAFAELRRCLEVVQLEHACPLEAIHVWHSGGRGAHVTIPPVVLGAEVGHPLLPHVYGAMVQRLFPQSIAPSLDRSIYNMRKGRMWRLSNRLRSDTGRYKIPLAMREALHRPSAELEALTTRPRKGIFWPPDEELSSCPALVQLYQEIATALEKTDVHRPADMHRSTAPSGDVNLLLARCAFGRHCRDDAASLSEPEWFAMVSNVARCENGPAAVHELSGPYPNYTAQETDAKIAHALTDTGPHTCAFVQAQGFTGCPPGGCGVKAPIGLAHRPVSETSRRYPSRIIVEVA